MAQAAALATELQDLPELLVGKLATEAARAHQDAGDDVVASGVVQGQAVQEDATGFVSTLLAARRRTAEGDPLSDEEESSLIKSILFPPLPQSDVRRIVYGNGWSQRLLSLTRLAAPRVIAETVANTTAAGGGVNQLRRALMPVLGNVKSAARRVARTEYLRVAQHAQNEAYSEIDDMIVGYQVHAVLDERTRPKHRKRAGWQYFKNPKPGQRSMSECPNPPMEEDGSVAHNCRCFRTPIFGKGNSDAPDESANAFDHADAAEWYDKAPSNLQTHAIGSERMRVATEVLGRRPRWNEVVSPSGSLLSNYEIVKRYGRMTQA